MVVISLFTVTAGLTVSTISSLVAVSCCRPVSVAVAWTP